MNTVTDNINQSTQYFGFDRTSALLGPYFMWQSSSKPIKSEARRTQKYILETTATQENKFWPNSQSLKLELITELHEYLAMPEAVWPDVQAFVDASFFTYLLPLNHIPVPDISFANDGEINFSWEVDDIYIDLGFYGTKTFSYYAEGKDGKKHHGDKIPASDGFPQELVQLLVD